MTIPFFSLYVLFSALCFPSIYEKSRTILVLSLKEMDIIIQKFLFESTCVFYFVVFLIQRIMEGFFMHAQVLKQVSRYCHKIFTFFNKDRVKKIQ